MSNKIDYVTCVGGGSLAGNTVILYGRWRPVAQGRVLVEGFIRL